MGKFNITKKVSLAFLGEGHENDYLVFTQMSYKDAKDLMGLSENADDADIAINKLKDKFVEGRLTDEVSKEQLSVDKEDLDDVPLPAVKHAIQELVGVGDENL